MSNTNSSSDQKKKSVKLNNRLGLYTLNEKELKTELKRIDLSKRQYETYYSYEQRKLITRFANKLIRSSSNLEVILHQPESNLQASNSSPALNKTIKRGVSNLGFTHNKEEIDIKQRPITSIKSSLKSADSNQADSNKIKKNVRWTNDLFAKENSLASSDISILSNSSNKNKTTLYEINKKYDELLITLPDPTPKILLPQLISINRRSNSEIMKPSQSLNLEDNKHLNVNDQKLEEFDLRSKFLNILNREDSGFYAYKNCLGYDNFRNLLKSASNKKPIIKDKEKDAFTKNMESEKFINPFNQTEIRNELKKPTVSDDIQLKRSNSTNAMRRSSDFHKQIILKKKKEDEKLMVDTFKAQNIRSLTFKHITTY